MKHLILLLFFLNTPSCRSLESDTTHTNSLTSNNQTLVFPAPGSTNNPLDVDVVVQAMNNTYNAFYGTTANYSKLPPNRQSPPNYEPNTCYGACPIGTRWSYLMCAYYCQLPSYSNVVPNMRGCFSEAVQSPVKMADGTPPRPLSYPEAYDYCVFQDYDVVLGRTPSFAPSVIATNKAAHRKPGVMKWIDDNQEKVFKYIMFNSGNPNVFNAKDEEKAITRFNQGGHFALLPPGPLPPAPPKLTGSCGGKMVNGYCWYGATISANGDCVSTCAAHGGIHPATFYNFGRSAEDCNKAVETVIGKPFSKALDTSCGGFCGCVYDQGFTTILCTNPPAVATCPSSLRRRICACNQ